MANLELKRILLAEDDLFLQKMYAVKLGREGLEVDVADDGEKALAAMRARRPDVVLLDIIMPKKDGFTVLEEMKADSALKDIPVIVLSNLGEVEDVKRAKRLGADDYLIKAHFLPSEVVAVVKKYIK